MRIEAPENARESARTKEVVSIFKVVADKGIEMSIGPQWATSFYLYHHARHRRGVGSAAVGKLWCHQPIAPHQSAHVMDGMVSDPDGSDLELQGYLILTASNF